MFHFILLVLLLCVVVVDLGTLYNNIAGVTATVAVQLRDYYGNKLQTGGRSLKLALLRMAGNIQLYLMLFINLLIICNCFIR